MDCTLIFLFILIGWAHDVSVAIQDDDALYILMSLDSMKCLLNLGHNSEFKYYVPQNQFAQVSFNILSNSIWNHF